MRSGITILFKLGPRKYPRMMAEGTRWREIGATRGSRILQVWLYLQFPSEELYMHLTQCVQVAVSPIQPSSLLAK